MRAILLQLISLCISNAYIGHFYQLHRLNRSLPSPIHEGELPSWDDGEVAWDIDSLKNITKQPVKMKPTPFDTDNLDHVFYILLDW
jgi:hypothetical protein